MHFIGTTAGIKGVYSMKKETYLAIFKKIKSVNHGVELVCFIGKIMTYMTAVIYLLSVVYTFIRGEIKETAGIIIVPAVSFLLLSLFRVKFNAKRPYEIYEFEPLIKKDTEGKSFPSRHVFSIFVIGSTLWCVYPYIGTVIMAAGVVLAVIRVIVGVHFPKDVIAGAVIGYLCGLFTMLFSL